MKTYESFQGLIDDMKKEKSFVHHHYYDLKIGWEAGKYSLHNFEKLWCDMKKLEGDNEDLKSKLERSKERLKRLRKNLKENYKKKKK